MSMRSVTTVIIVILALAGYARSVAQETPNLGRSATPAEIAGWDISIPPDGTGLPPGSGTPEQGAAVYTQKCQVRSKRKIACPCRISDSSWTPDSMG